jgi:hypothetical protein
MNVQLSTHDTHHGKLKTAFVSATEHGSLAGWSVMCGPELERQESLPLWPTVRLSIIQPDDSPHP